MIDYGSQVLLSTLDFQEGESVLDVGCGYGPIGLSLAKAQGVAVTMVDVNERALDLAKKMLAETAWKFRSFLRMSMKQ